MGISVQFFLIAPFADHCLLLLLAPFYLFQRDGLWIGTLQNKIVRLDKLYNDRARIQVYPDRFGAPPILSIEYDVTKRPMDAFVDLCNLADNCHNP